MKSTHALALIAAALLAWIASPALASPQWQSPAAQECDLAPGGECNVEVTCPADRPILLAGGGGMPAAEPQNHAVAITMSLPISNNTWRVRWKNLSADVTAKVKVAVRVLCDTE